MWKSLTGMVEQMRAQGGPQLLIGKAPSGSPEVPADKGRARDDGEGIKKRGRGEKGHEEERNEDRDIR